MITCEIWIICKVHSGLSDWINGFQIISLISFSLPAVQNICAKCVHNFFLYLHFFLKETNAAWQSADPTAVARNSWLGLTGFTNSKIFWLSGCVYGNWAHTGCSTKALDPVIMTSANGIGRDKPGLCQEMICSRCVALSIGGREGGKTSPCSVNVQSLGRRRWADNVSGWFWVIHGRERARSLQKSTLDTAAVPGFKRQHSILLGSLLDLVQNLHDVIHPFKEAQAGKTALSWVEAKSMYATV